MSPGLKPKKSRVPGPGKAQAPQAVSQSQRPPDEAHKGRGGPDCRGREPRDDVQECRGSRRGS